MKYRVRRGSPRCRKPSASRRAPALSLALAIFILSLAGIPPLSGFFAKFYLFVSVLDAAPANTQTSGLLWLVILAIAMSAVSLYYYLKVLKRVYVAAPPPNAPALHLSATATAVILLIAAATVLLGCFPHLLLNPILSAIRYSGL